MNPSTVNDIIRDSVSIWSNVTSLIFQQVEGEDADIKLSFWELGKKLPEREGGFGVLYIKGKCSQSINKNLVHLVQSQKKKKKSGKILMEINKSITQERHFSVMKQ